jgi:hypothetical protein
MLAPTIYDTFGRIIAGGMGTSTSGHQWISTVTADTTAVPPTATTPGYGVHTCTTSGVRISTVGPSVADSDMRFGLAVSALSTGSLFTAGAVARFASVNSYYYFRIDFNTDQVIGYQIRKVVGGTDTAIAAGLVGGLTQVLGGSYWARAKVTGSALQLKVWSDATGEPSEWTATTFDGSLSTGTIGVRTDKPGGNTNASIAVKYFYVTCSPYADVSNRALPYELEVALGADINTNPATWSWTIITGDVYLGDGSSDNDAGAPAVTISYGRADWAGQADPAELSATLINTSWDYTPYNTSSANWPNVVRNVPVRLRLLYNIIAFFGYSNGWPQSWPTLANEPTVALVATGILRRLGQGVAPAQSALRRALGSSSPVAYWPMEDGASASHAASGLTGGAPLVVTGGSVNFGSAAGPPGSASLPDFSAGGGMMTGTVQSGTVGSWRVEFVAMFPASFTGGNFAAPLQWATAGGVAIWEVDATDAPDGGLSLQYITSSGGFGGPFSSNVKVDDGKWHHIRVDASQSGGNIALTVKLDGTTVISQTLSTLAMGLVKSIAINPTGAGTEAVPSVGHLAVWAPYASTVDTVAAFRGYAGEAPTTRLARICAEDGVPLTIAGTSGIPMGPQYPGALVGWGRECETVDVGALIDGQGAGLFFIAHTSRQNPAAALTVDVSNEQIGAPFVAPDDDQRIVNDVTASAPAGSSYEYIDSNPNHPLSTKRVGTYTSSVTANVGQPSLLVGQASWRVHMGTMEGFRYPTVALDLCRSPELGGSWLDVDICGRIDLTNLPVPHSPSTISLAVDGVRQEIGDFCWNVMLNCSLAEPWRCTVVGTNRVDTENSWLNAGASLGATSISVRTDSPHRLWTVGTGLSYDLKIAGIQVHVTAVSGTSSPQTFTVSGVTKALPNGSQVRLWRPTYIGIGV